MLFQQPLTTFSSHAKAFRLSHKKTFREMLVTLCTTFKTFAMTNIKQWNHVHENPLDPSLRQRCRAAFSFEGRHHKGGVFHHQGHDLMTALWTRYKSNDFQVNWPCFTSKTLAAWKESWAMADYGKPINLHKIGARNGLNKIFWSISKDLFLFYKPLIEHTYIYILIYL